MNNHDFNVGKVIVTLNRDFFCHDTSDCYYPVLEGVEFTKVENIFRSEARGCPRGDIILVHLDCGEEESVFDAIETLTANPMVMFAEPDFIFDNHLIPNDPYFGYLWGLERIMAPNAWDYTTGNANVVVGVVDSGIDFTHPDIADNIWFSQDGYPGWNFINDSGDSMDMTGHGTHVAGTIGAVGNNMIGITGTAWNVKLASLKIGESCFSLASAVAAIQYANENDIPILNCSWGGRHYIPSLRHAIEQYNGLFIASAGNSGSDNDLDPEFPASFDCDNIISVAAANTYDELSLFSNYGALSVDLAAPGTYIYSLSLGGEYSYMDGTSMSAPYVAGAAALLKSYLPNLTALEMKDIILSSVSKHPNLNGLVSSGGILNVNTMLKVGNDYHSALTAA
ncbi:MAG: S8 family serine peptidase [Defluviitaleaceae bacterium]|nr:S8 family serine peptidase [Defluviitaleaceae bacterium]